MTTGLEALRALDGAIVHARDALRRAADSGARQSAQAAQLERRQAGLFHQFAQVRLDLMKIHAAPAALGEAEERAAALLADHDAAVGRLQGDERETEARIAELEARRLAEEGTRADADAALDAAVQVTRARLDSDPAYQAAARAADEADAVAERAAQKLDLAKADREEKGGPYRADPLFSYLWDRGWGTARYQGGGLFRMLDAWVAGLVAYEDARRNFARLTELPDRLAEHLEQVEREATAADERVGAAERAALVADGAEALEAALEAADAALAQTDADIEAAEAAHNAAAAALAAAAEGEGGPYAEAREVLAEALAARSIPDLRVLAAETLTPEDDRVVDALISARRQAIELDLERENARRRPERYQAFLQDLEGVRRKFKAAGFDRSDSVFTRGEPIAVLLEQFHRGGLSADGLWRKLKRAHRRVRRRANPVAPSVGGVLGEVLDELLDVDLDDLGSPRFPTRSRGSWGGRSRRRSRPRPPRMPRSRGRRGGGGFRTGGGF